MDDNDDDVEDGDGGLWQRGQRDPVMVVVIIDDDNDKDDNCIVEAGQRGGTLGCTFRFTFQFLGGWNPGQDSCSGRIPVESVPAESGHNIPDAPPFLRAGTLLPLQTGKRSGLI